MLAEKWQPYSLLGKLLITYVESAAKKVVARGVGSRSADTATDTDGLLGCFTPTHFKKLAGVDRC